jgi:hypothetical protein
MKLLVREIFGGEEKRLFIEYLGREVVV